MTRRICLILAVICLDISPCLAEVVGEISYELTALGDDRWLYEYSVTNAGTDAVIDEFTIWFDDQYYANIVIETALPLSGQWSELAIEPEPWVPHDGFYDAFSLTNGIGAGDSVVGFSVSFDWRGSGVPEGQPFEVVDPVSFDTLCSGWTVAVPEPTYALLLTLASLASGRGCRRR